MSISRRQFSPKLAGKPGTRRKGQETRQKIIDVARRVLIDQGYEQFVLRQIALEAGIRPGNLQYYFGSKKELLSAVLLHEISRYEDVYEGIAAEAGSAAEVARELVRFLLEEIRRKSTTNIWYVVWSQSAHDADLADVMDAWYLEYMYSLRALFRRTVPGISDARAGHAASLITALMDGLTNQLGHGRRRHRIHDRIESAVECLVRDLLESP